jgi:hypothetical protein
MASEAVSKDQLTNIAAEFDYKMIQAQLALADGDKTTASKLQKELLELQFELENRTKWMLGTEDEAADPDMKENLAAMHSVLVEEAPDRRGLDTADKIVNELQNEEEVVDTTLKEYPNGRHTPSTVPVQDFLGKKEMGTPKFFLAESGESPHYWPKYEPRKSGTGSGSSGLPDSSDYLWWLGQEGYEERTNWWIELGHEKRKQIIQNQCSLRRLPMRYICFKNNAQDTCSCGERCWVREVGERMDKLYPKDGLTKEEREAEDRARKSESEHQRFTFKIQRLLKLLENQADRGKNIDLSVEKCLREILALAKGKQAGEGPYDLDPVIKDGPEDSDGKYAELLKLYCRWTGRNEQLDFDLKILDYAKKLVEKAEQQKAEKAKQSKPSRANF